MSLFLFSADIVPGQGKAKTNKAWSPPRRQADPTRERHTCAFLPLAYRFKTDT